MIVSLLLASALAAFPADDKTDALCVAASEKLIDFADAADKSGVEGSMLYFLGRLTGRHTDAEVRALIATARAALTDDAQVAAHGQRCGDELMKTAEAVDA